MSVFRKAVRCAIAQYQFRYRDQPWKAKAAIAAIEDLLRQADFEDDLLSQNLASQLPVFHKKVTNIIGEYLNQTDNALYEHLWLKVNKISKEYVELKVMLTNVLNVYKHSLIAAFPLDSAQAFIKIENVVQEVDLTKLCKKSGIIAVIGYNEISHQHIIHLQFKKGDTQIYWLLDIEHQYGAGVSLRQKYEPGQLLLTQRLRLSEIPEYQFNARDRFLVFLQGNGSSRVLSVVEPCSFDPNGEIALLTEKGERFEIDLQGQPLFIGQSNTQVRDDTLSFRTEDENSEKCIPIRIWQRPPTKNKELQAKSFATSAKSFSKAKPKIILALHGLFDHKGTYKALAHTLLAMLPEEAITVIALDWPTYGASTNRNNPMPSSRILKEYLLGALNAIQRQYVDGEIYLVGESLGAMMILIAGEALSQFQTQHNCIKGVIAVSPALHHPDHNLCFQWRSSHLSASPSIFKNIWFNDPEVNHSNCVARIKATLPYLEETYKAVKKWPESVPCALLFASKDCVTGQKSVITLYQSMKNPMMVFYAFPARHLILRSVSENGDFIEGELVRKDIAALIDYMDRKTFSMETVLPYTGAESAATMRWYQHAYTQNFSRSGYLDSWPHSLQDEYFLLKRASVNGSSEEHPKEAAEAEQKPLWLGKLAENVLIEFREHEVIRDGDCGFHALGITRDQLVETLIVLKNNEAAHRFLAPEIRFSLLSQDIPERLKPKSWFNLHAQYQKAWQQLENLMGNLKAQVIGPYPPDFDLEGRVKWLSDHVQPDQQQLLLEAFQSFSKMNVDIDTYCQQSEIFEDYLELYRLPNLLWLGYNSAFLWASIQKVSLYLWRKDEKSPKRLVLVRSQVAPEERNVFHLFHTSGFTHFNLLEVLKTRDPRIEMAQMNQWNQTQVNFHNDLLLHEFFLYQAEKQPDALAIVSHRGNKTYAEIANHSFQVAHALKSMAVKPNQLVGVIMEKGWEQAVACLGILQSGAAFLPIDPDWPETRIQEVLMLGEVSIVLSQKAILQRLSSLPELEIDREQEIRLHEYLISEYPLLPSKALDITKDYLRGIKIKAFAVDDPLLWTDFPMTSLPRQQCLEDIAYVIFTSGSTGKPKGVVINHQAVINTILDINQRFSVTHQDRVLSLSNLTFDLSIYDFFGLLAAGGTVVLPESDKIKEPAHWLMLLEQYQITLWNTVPMFMQMLVDYLEQLPVREYARALSLLRVVLLSGDWIPVTLPNRIRQLSAKVSIISLGGATEGSIWSILYPIKHLDPTWKSIPYGRPMANQTLSVLNEKLEPCVFGEVGEIYIGGVGVAVGYWHDPENTARNFVKRPQTGEILYKTGDLGTWSSQGFIEFLGRKDLQVKISGYRIELGEIETVLSKHPAVHQCIVVPYTHHQQKQLVAYIVPSAYALQLKNKREHTHAWETVYDETYQNSTSSEVLADPAFNIVGWNSSYTGKPIPFEEMREWVQNTVFRILAYRPKRVLEIGCGTGLLLSHIAPHCESYVGTDISAQALAYVEKLKQHESRLAHLQLYKLEATDLAEMREDHFDAIIINSVIQCFPSIEYLIQVIEMAAKRLTNGGVIFLGDIRSLHLLDLFHTSVQFFQASELSTREMLQQSIQKRCAEETELLIHPYFFQILQQKIPTIQHIDIQLKRGKFANELNKFRYDVCLTIAERPISTLKPQWEKARDPFITLKDVRQNLVTFFSVGSDEIDQPVQAIGFRNIANTRLQAELRIATWLQGGDYSAQNVAELRALDKPPLGIDPTEFYALGQELGLEVVTSWHQTDQKGTYDVVFIRHRSSAYLASHPLVDFGIKVDINLDYHLYANNPVDPHQQDLIPLLQIFLRESLPSYMIPKVLMITKYLPLSSNGKVDRQALPAPLLDSGFDNRQKIAPSDPIGKTLLRLWIEVLSISQIGIQDNFFNLGGNSLLAVRLALKINKAFERSFTVSMIFTNNTIEKQAHLIQEKFGNQKGNTSFKSDHKPLLAFNEKGCLPALFLVHSGRGGAEAYITLASHFPPNQPLYALEPYNFYSGPPFLNTIEEMATQYLQFIRDVQPKGPYYLGGWSQGGLIAYEMAQQLIQQKEEVRVIYLLDTFLYHDYEAKQFLSGMDNFVSRDPFYKKLPEQYREHAQQVDKIQTIAMLKYKPRPYEGAVVLLKAKDRWKFIDTPEFGWNLFTKQFVNHAFSKKHNGWSNTIENLTIYPVPGDHQSIMDGENAKRMSYFIQADSIKRYLSTSSSESTFNIFQFKQHLSSAQVHSEEIIKEAVKGKKISYCTIS